MKKLQLLATLEVSKCSPAGEYSGTRLEFCFPTASCVELYQSFIFLC